MSAIQRLISWLKAGSDTAPAPATGTSPEVLRRYALSLNSRLVLVFGLVGALFALPALVGGMLLSFTLAIIVVAAGVTTLALHRRSDYQRAAEGHAEAMLVLGLILTLADPAPVDFGLGVALLAPVYASLFARREVLQLSWVALAVVAGVDALATTGAIAWPETFRPEYGVLAALVFAAATLLVARSASRLNALYETYEKAQANAFRHLIENVQEAVIRFGADGRVLFASRSSELLFGCRRYELSGNGLVERVHVHDKPAFLHALADAGGNGAIRRVEVRMRRDDAGAVAAAPQFIWVEASLSPLLEADLPDGRHDVVALVRDITERKDVEDELRRARKAAEDASVAKSRFLGTVGHELRTPLNAIVGFSEMMTSGVVGDLSPQHREYATLIHQSGQHLIEIVRMLLDMSRLEAGKFELQAEPFAPESLVEPCLKMVDGLARERSVRLQTELARNLPMVVADERACRQILINLLSNAVKFSFEHSVVTLGMKRQGKHLMISVRDRGIGMGPDAVERIGEPFFQAQDGLARRYEGTGLGLSIVKGLVDLHGGSLVVSSAPGEGTVMTVMLPINGPETKLEDTREPTPLRRDPAPQQMPAWHDDERRKAL